MQAVMNKINVGYKDIRIIGDDANILPNIQGSPLSGCTSYMPHLLGMNSTADLLVIDMDTFGFEETHYLVFLAYCFAPETPLVIHAVRSVPQWQYNDLMRAGNVLDVVEAGSNARLTETD